uniref:Protein quiver n=1 Tax=Panagrellus redivivus TaxID=6233 RepID=A0A7E4V7D3_PANRE
MLLPLTTVLLTFLSTTSGTTKTCYSCYDGSNSDIHGTLLKYFTAQHPIQTLLPFGDVICRKPRSIQCTDACVGIKIVKNDTLRGSTTNYFMGCSEHFEPVSDENPLKCTFRNEEVAYNRYVFIEYCTCGLTMCNDPKKSMPLWTLNDAQKKEYFNMDPPTTPKPKQVINSAGTSLIGSVFLLNFFL